MTEEYSKFEAIADQWWDEDGKFSILHHINPLRIKYIVNQITAIKSLKYKKKDYLEKCSIIDIGCGGGLVCEPLARLGANVSGLDFVEKNINVAKDHAKKEFLKINYFLSDIDKLNLKKKYDVVLLLEVLEHLDNWENISKKINLYLKPNGILIISTINRNIFSFFGAILIAERILKWIPKKTHSYEKLIKIKEITNTLEKNNFKISDISGLFYNPIKRKWNIDKSKIKINYFCTAIKIN